MPQRIRLAWLCGTAGALMLVLLLWRVPQWTVPSDISDSREKAELLNANRDSILKAVQTIGSLGFVATAYLAWRNLKVAEQNFQVSEDKQVTDRFSKAVEMLADDNLAVRLGGIYSLERIAKDSREDHSIIMEVLTAFVRATSPRIDLSEQGSLQHKWANSDIQSALNVIGRRYFDNDRESINLGYTNLNGMSFSKGMFNEAVLEGAQLDNADLYGTQMKKANLSCAVLNEASFCLPNYTHATSTSAILLAMLPEMKEEEFSGWITADLEEANLCGCQINGGLLIRVNLEKANLSFSKLQNSLLAFANLRGTNLRSASLDEAYLRGANLEEADLVDASLESADLSDASLKDADFSLVDLRNVKGLTEHQLSEAKLCHTLLPDNIKLDPDKDCESLGIQCN